MMYKITELKSYQEMDERLFTELFIDIKDMDLRIMLSRFHTELHSYFSYEDFLYEKLVT